MTYILSAVACFLVFPSGALAQVAVTGRITAEVVDVLATSASGFGSSYTLPVKYTSSSGSAVAAPAINVSPAVFSIYGIKDVKFEVSLPEGTTIIKANNGNGSIEVGDWTATSSNPGAGNPKLSSGAQQVTVGATIRSSSGAENPKGLYTGSYQVTFVYNNPIHP